MNPKRRAKWFKLFRFTKLPYLPTVLGIEPGNLCNLSCPLCPTGQKAEGVKKGFLDFDFFKHVFDQFKGNLEGVNLYNWGEPLLNKDLIKIIRYIKEVNKDIKVITSTNLNVADKRLLEELIDSGIDEIIVSCDGASKENYEKYRVGGDFDLVMYNMDYLARCNKELNSRTQLIWNFLVFRHNEHEIDKAREMAEKLGVFFRIGLMRTSMKDEILKPHKDAIAKDKDWIPDNPVYSAYDKEKCAPKRVIKTCRKPWQEISINWDGKVFPCCAVYGDQYSLGDAKIDSIKDIWNNKLFMTARREILRAKQHACTICGICRNNGFMHM